LISAGYKICVVRDSLVQHIGFSEGQNSSFASGDIGIGFSDMNAQNAYHFIERVAFSSQAGFRLMQTQIDAMLQREAAAERRYLETGQAISRNEDPIEQRFLGRIDGSPLCMDMRRLVGQNVRRVREKRGLTQEQFADRSGFSLQYISGLEGGHCNPTVVTVYELAAALGVSHMDLMRPIKKPAKD
jgi:DNA-binding XRE family transcriptional regulator